MPLSQGSAPLKDDLELQNLQPLRRAAPLQPADWFGFYRFDNVEDERWRCCRVIDLSPKGAGLELFGVTPGEHVEGVITISMEHRGITRNVIWNEEAGSVRVGIEFPEITETAKEYIRSLSGARSRW